MATPSAATQSGLQSAFQQGFGNAQNANSAIAGLQPYINGSRLNLSSNPYFKDAVNAYTQPLTQNFTDVQTPAMRSQFEGSGRNLGGADMSTFLQASRNFNQGLDNSTAQFANNAYQQGQQNQIQAAGLIPGLNSSALSGVGSMVAGGAGIDANNQAQLNDLIARYTYGQTAQPNYLSDQANRFLAAYPGGATQSSGSSSGYSSGTPAQNGGADFLGAGLGIAGTVAKFLPFLPSDERLKEDIQKVGELKDGQNIYSYRFIGSPRTEIGLLAQEVEKVHPEAVATHPAGYKMVDYGRATAPSGGLL